MRKEIIPSIILGLITPVLVYYGITFAVTALGIVTVSLAGSASLHDMNNISRILARYTMTFQVIAAGISIIPLAFMMRRDRPKRRFYYEKKKHGLWYAAALVINVLAGGQVGPLFYLSIFMIGMGIGGSANFTTSLPTSVFGRQGFDKVNSVVFPIQGFVTAWCFVVNGIVTNAIGNLSVAYMIFAGGAVLVSVLVSFMNEYKFNKDHAAEHKSA